MASERRVTSWSRLRRPGPPGVVMALDAVAVREFEFEFPPTSDLLAVPGLAADSCCGAEGERERREGRSSENLLFCMSTRSPLVRGLYTDSGSKRSLASGSSARSMALLELQGTPAGVARAALAGVAAPIIIVIAVVVVPMLAAPDPRPRRADAGTPPYGPPDAVIPCR